MVNNNKRKLESLPLCILFFFLLLLPFSLGYDYTQNFESFSESAYWTPDFSVCSNVYNRTTYGINIESDYYSIQFCGSSNYGTYVTDAFNNVDYGTKQFVMWQRGEHGYGYIHEFDRYYRFTEDSKIEFDIMFTQTATGVESFDFVFFTQNNTCYCIGNSCDSAIITYYCDEQYSLLPAKTGNQYRYTPITNISYSKDKIIHINMSMDNANETFYNTNFAGYIVWMKNNWDGNQNVSIDNINFSQLLYSNISGNVLPVCEFIYNTTNICLDTSLGYGEFNVELNCSDGDGDTIYYSQGVTDYLQRYVFHYEPFGDYSFFTNGNFVSNYSYTEDEDDSNLWLGGWTLVPYSALGSLYGNNILMTENGVDEWIYKLNYPITNTSSIDYIIGFPYDDTKVNVEYFDSLGNVQLNLSYYQKDGNMSIELGGNLIFNEEAYLMNSQYENYYNVVTFVSPGENRSYVYIDTDSGGSVETIVSNWTYDTNYNDVRYIKFNTWDEHSMIKDFWVLDELQIRGWFKYQALFFDTVYQSIFRFNETGDFNINYYISDSVNQPDNYREYTLPITVSDFFCDVSKDEDFEDLVQIPGALMDALGIRSIFQTALWIFYFVMLVTFVFTIKDFKIAWLFANIVFLLMSWSFGSLVQLVSGIVLLAGSIVTAVLL